MLLLIVTLYSMTDMTVMKQHGAGVFRGLTADIQLILEWMHCEQHSHYAASHNPLESQVKLESTWRNSLVASVVFLLEAPEQQKPNAFKCKSSRIISIQFHKFSVALVLMLALGQMETALLKSHCTPYGNECQKIEALHKQGQLC